jgi:hypothetical protein
VFTNNPSEVPTHQTTPSAGDVVAMLLLGWPELKPNGARTLAAQFMAETGGGKFCFNWNLGNVKAAPTDMHMYLMNVWECDTPASAAIQVQNASGLAHIATPEEILQHGWSCPGSVVVVFQPPHPQCRFRAYPTLALGAQHWLGYHQRLARTNVGYLTAVNAGDIRTVAHLLKLAHYYTAAETDYVKNMTAQKNVIDQKLGPLQQTPGAG